MWRPLLFAVITCAILPILTGASSKSSKVNCFQHNNTCNDCVAIKDCYFCSKTNVCWRYNPSITHFIPPESECPKSDAYQGQCLFSTTVLIIAVLSGAGVLLIALGCIIYCCCCKKSKKRILKEEQRHFAEMETRREKREQRHNERQAKRDEYRKKYGLLKDHNSAGYNRLS